MRAAGAEHAPAQAVAVSRPTASGRCTSGPKGPAASWPAQLQAQYAQQPVFAVLSGMAPGSWQPIHDFCEQNQVPCLFPVTDLPVVDEQSFYTVYLSQGMTLEADAIARHLFDDGPLVAGRAGLPGG